MRQPVLILVLAMLLLAGCAAPDDPGSGDPLAQPIANMWQAGLADHYETPDVALTRSADERRAVVAPPGDPGFAQFDQLMVSVMDRYEIPAASLAVMHDGRLLYASGYGHTNPDGTGTTDADTMFRMASVGKPIAHALLSLQIAEGLYGWDDPVFCLPPAPRPDCRLPLTPHPDWPVVDERMADITVAMLLDHTGGFDPSIVPDKLQIVQEMREAFDLDGMPELWHAATYLMGTTLVNDPGTRVSYCNVCYELAGLVAEAATGTDLQALYDAYLFRPLEVEGDIELGKMPLAQRNPREPFYVSGVERTNVYDPNETVDGADGEYHFEITSSAGAFIGTPEAVAAVYEAYPAGIPTPQLTTLASALIDPYNTLYHNQAHTGLLFGTNSVSWRAEDLQTDTGVIQYVALFNADRIRPNTGCPDDIPGTSCVGWMAFRNDMFLLAAEKAREA